jgi:hypothetical protein
MDAEDAFLCVNSQHTLFTVTAVNLKHLSAQHHTRYVVFYLPVTALARSYLVIYNKLVLCVYRFLTCPTVCQ